MEVKIQKKFGLSRILSNELGKQNNDLKLRDDVMYALKTQLNLILEIKKTHTKKYQLSNANDLSSPAYTMDKHFAGFNYWRNS